MLTTERLLAIALLVILPVSPGTAQPVSAGDIAVEAPWSRATPPGARVGLAYMRIENSGAEPDRLISARSARAPATEIHSMSITGGVMEMDEIEDGLEIPSQGRLDLAPGSYHLMLVGIETPLAQDEIVPLTLVFERAGEIEVAVPVRSIGARGPATGEGHGEPDATHEGHGEAGHEGH